MPRDTQVESEYNAKYSLGTEPMRKLDRVMFDRNITVEHSFKDYSKEGCFVCVESRHYRGYALARKDTRLYTKPRICQP